VETIVKYLQQAPSTPESIPHSQITTSFMKPNFKEAKKEFERQYLKAKLQENKGNITQTAEMLGMERSHLHKKLKTLDIEISASD
jgi:two-component system nitrogen regulation response regulator NtrX